MVERDFSFFLPVTLVKADPSAKGQTRVGGIAATDQTDIEGERLVMKGMDVSYLESGRGVFNWNHGNNPGDIVGRIDKVEKSDSELYVEGYLYDGVRKADDIRLLMKAMTGTGSHLGFSVEGKVSERDGDEITKSWIKAVAMTHEPVNPYTLADFMKSLRTSKPEASSNIVSPEGIVTEMSRRDARWYLLGKGLSEKQVEFVLAHAFAKTVGKE